MYYARRYTIVEMHSPIQLFQPFMKVPKVQQEADSNNGPVDHRVGLLYYYPVNGRWAIFPTLVMAEQNCPSWGVIEQ